MQACFSAEVPPPISAAFFIALCISSTNLAPVEESGVRFMCHPAVPLKRHLDLHVRPATENVAKTVV